MTELLHSIHWFDFDLEIVREAIVLAEKCLKDSRDLPVEVSLGIEYFATTDPIGKRCVVPESDLIIIANGLVLLEDTPEYRHISINTKKNNIFMAVRTRVAKHLGREFIL